MRERAIGMTHNVSDLYKIGSDTTDAFLNKEESGLYESSSIEIRNFLRKLKRINKEINSLISAINMTVPSESEYDYYELTVPTMTVAKEDNLYHMILDDLIPHRITYSMSGKKLKYDYLRSEVYSGYKKAMVLYEKEHTMSKAKELTYALFVNYFAKGDRIADLDNLDQKPFIDAIKEYLLKDDSPKYLRFIMEYKVGKKTHTEVYIGNKEDIQRKWQEICI